MGGVSRNNIAHIGSEGSVSDWNPGADGVVRTLDKYPSGTTLYAGGAFTNIGGQARNRIAALNTTSANATEWDPNADDLIFSLQLHPDQSTLYAGGFFTSIGGETRHYLAGLDISDGSATEWNPNPQNIVYSLSINDAGHTIYEVWRGLDANGADAAKITTTTATDYDDTGVTANINYYYRIKAINAAGKSSFSTAAHGYVGTAGPMITANGQVGDHVALARGTPLTLAVRLHKHDLPTVPVDWWVAAHAAHSGQWYYLDQAMHWNEFDGQAGNCRPAHMGELIELAPTTVAAGLQLSPGIYYVWFAIDYPMDGVLDLSGPHLLARVVVTVE